MQLALLEAGVQGRICSPNLTALRTRQYQCGSVSVASQSIPLRRPECEAITATAQPSSSASLFPWASLVRGLPSLKLQPKPRTYGVRAEARGVGAYDKDAFTSEEEASRLAQVGSQRFCVSRFIFPSAGVFVFAVRFFPQTYFGGKFILPTLI